MNTSKHTGRAQTASVTRTDHDEGDLVTVREIQMIIATGTDLVIARQRARMMAEDIGFPQLNVTLSVVALSELLHNIIKFAQRGRLMIKETATGRRRGIHFTVSDGGPGIPNIAEAMREGYSTGQGLGLGLPGCQRLMDDFEIESKVGKGTVVRMTKWIQK